MTNDCNSLMLVSSRFGYSLRKLQFPHHCFEARLLAQGVQERVGLQNLQARVTQPQRRLKPFERLGPIAPLRVDRGVLVRRGIALPLPLVSRARLPHPRGGRACHRSPRGTIDSPSGPASSRMRRVRAQDRRARNRRTRETRRSSLEVGVKTDDFCESRNRLLIAAGHIQRLAERTMALGSERVEHDGAPGSGKAHIKVPHEGCK